jgi:hypothetical protein
MNAHTKLKLHLDRWMYKRGRNKGDAPADSSRRAKTHFRVVQGNGGQMIVRFHNADIISAYEDGHIVLNTRGWHASPTTRSAMNDALCFFGMGAVGTVRNGGYSQTGIRMNGKTYRYYDGMEFAADGTPLTPLKTFTAKRTDREETAEFRADIKESGFVDTFPVLFAAVTPEQARYYVRSTKDAMCSEHLAGQWPTVVAQIKYQNKRYYRYYSHRPAAYDNHKDALRALVASITKNMTKIVDTDVTVL